MASFVSADEQSALQTPVRVDAPAAVPRRRRVRDRLSLGHLFMIGAALLAFILVVSLLQDRGATARVLVADAEILPGVAITPGLVREVEIPAEADVVDSLATLDDLRSTPARAAYRIAAGDPITVTALTPAATPSALRAMSLPIDRVRAVGGDLGPGDRVDVISVEGGVARYIALDLEVLATQSDTGRGAGITGSALSTYFVTVSVDDQTALGLALAMERGDVTVLRSTGAEPVAATDRLLSGPDAVGRTSVEDSNG